MQKDVHIVVFTTHFMDKVIKDGIDSVDRWYQKVRSYMATCMHVYSYKYSSQICKPLATTIMMGIVRTMYICMHIYM